MERPFTARRENTREPAFCQHRCFERATSKSENSQTTIAHLSYAEMVAP
jgi:hypothetical protein